MGEVLTKIVIVLIVLLLLVWGGYTLYNYTMNASPQTVGAAQSGGATTQTASTTTGFKSHNGKTY